VIITVALLSCKNRTEKEPSKIENPTNANEKTKAIPTDKIEVKTYDDFEYLI